MIRPFILIVMLAMTLPAWAQGDIDNVLDIVEQRNKDLEARRKLTEAQKLEARTGNYLYNPSVEFEQLWGNNKPAVSTGELNVVQGFDFPSVYVHRRKIAKLKQSLYDNEGAVVRQKILLEAKLLCLQIIYLNKRQEILKERLGMIRRITEAYRKKLDEGGANIIEYNKTAIEYVNANTQFEINKAALISANEKLRNMTGGEDVSFFLTEYPGEMPLPDFARLEAMFTENDPELQNIRSEAEVTDRNIDLSRALSLPKFEVGYRSNFGGGERFDGFMATMSIPMFENKNTVKAAKAQALYTRKRMESMKSNSLADLRQLYEEARTLESSLTQMRDILCVNDNISPLNKALEAGQISILEYLTESSLAYDNHLMMHEIESQYHQVKARLFSFEL